MDPSFHHPISSANFFAGKKYVNNRNEEIAFDYGSKITYVGLFFTGSWCPPCEKFAQELIEVYNDANSKERTMEIIQISNEKGEKEFSQSIMDKPWIFVQYNDNFVDYLVNEYKITHLPILIILTKDRNIISDMGRKDVLDNGIKVHEKWMKTYRVNKDKEKELSNMHDQN